jgi:pyridoxal phosphate enzyme (YggS family)
MIAENIADIRRRVVDRCRALGRDPDDVRIVAVSKTFPAPSIREVLRAGILDIGENYVQELLAKRRELAGEPIRWHMVGHLQTNKVRQLVPWISLVHGVDSLHLAEEIDRRSASAGTVTEVLIEVNTSGEDSKFGQMHALRHVRIAGLMTIGPLLPDPEGSRPMFRRLRDLREELRRMRQDNLDPVHLSMGMTGDFEVALEEGATLLRIGTAIFGERHPHSRTAAA